MKRVMLALGLMTVLSLGSALAPVACHAVTLGQVDTFQDGTTQNWVINPLGLGTPPSIVLPTNMATGGPSGAGDRFLQLTSIGGNAAGSRLVAVNINQWAGDYLAAGIGAITMDLNNFGATDLALRLLFENPTGGPPTDVAFSTAAVVVPAQGGWVHAVFPITVTSLTAETGSVADALSTATWIRIFHNPAPGFGGPFNGPPPVVALLGVDNITAVAAVPEPATGLLSGAGLVLSLMWRRRRHRG